MPAILLLGFASGLPLALTGSTLSTWLKDAGVTITAIGLFAAVAMPYSLKFFWAPLIDRLPLLVLTKQFGRRRGWMLLIQLLLASVIALMAFADPIANPWWTAVVALMLSTLSASQDIVLDAYRTERLKPEEYGPGIAMFTLGYRIGMLISGAGALYLAEYYGWQATYLTMAAIMGSMMLLTLLSREPDSPLIEADDKTESLGQRWISWFKSAVIAPFTNFMTREQWLLILLFIALYKLGDAFLGVMTNPFLLEIGFTKPQIASIVKIYGFAATIIGTFWGGSLAKKYGVYGPLFFCGLLHAATNMMFLVQVKVGSDPTPLFNWIIPLGENGWEIAPGTGSFVLALGIALENLSGGMSSAVLVVFISQLCNIQYTATQFALLSSLATLGRTTLSSSSGYFVKLLGWEGFFVFSVLLALPSLLLLMFLKQRNVRVFESKK